MPDTIEFFPFHALNEFMRDDFRQTVVQSTLSGLPNLPETYKTEIDRHVKKGISIPGFRKPEKAPTQLKVTPIAKSFEKNPEMVAAVINAWAELHPELRQKVYNLLTSRGWELLPLEAERARLPGFLLKWPKSEDFETLYKAYGEANPEETTSVDEVCLMVVWMADRLPYEIVDDDVKAVTHTVDLEQAKKELEEKEPEEGKQE